TDIIIDYCGKQYVCEMKLWHGEEYHQRGEKQLIGYLEDYHLSTGYMVSFNFNKNKKTGIRKKQIDGKLLIEAVV
ncbi:MAG: 9-O-acetyl-N-acetylneuraminate esterase, partial [Lachnospiraceae bacterium]|nr:9-O-acetyl-N-acetylneuraminate esterase [Lachnospiraceae bacterium]